MRVNQHRNCGDNWTKLNMPNGKRQKQLLYWKIVYLYRSHSKIGIKNRCNYIYITKTYKSLLYIQHLQRLYTLGARKFVLTGIGKMGCIPTMLARAEDGQCLDTVNQAVLPFNANVKQMIYNFNTTLPDANFVFIDTDKMFQHIINNSKIYGTYLHRLIFILKIIKILIIFQWLKLFIGFTVFDRGCCGVGKNSGEVTCLPFETPCSNRQEYLFWDAFHPTSAVNVILGNLAFNGSYYLVYPMNILQLAQVWYQIKASS